MNVKRLHLMDGFAKSLRTGILAIGILVLLATGTFVATGGQVLAARSTAAPRALRAASSTSVPPNGANTYGYSKVSTGEYYDPPYNGWPCYDGWREVDGYNQLTYQVFYFRMSTEWCFDSNPNGTVIAHWTRIWGDVEAGAIPFGWISPGRPPIQFNCYKAYDNRSNCSGNSESATWAFLNWQSNEEVIVQITEDENFLGDFYPSDSVSCIDETTGFPC